MKTIFLFAALSMLPCLSAAEYINLQINPATYFSKGNARVRFTVQNNGTASAANVAVKATLGKTQAQTGMWQQIGVNETVSTNLSLGKPPSPPGIYTVVLKAVYKDPGGHSFSSLEVFPLVTADLNISQMESELDATLNSTSITDQGILKFSLQAGKSFSGTVRFVAPDELQCSPRKTQIKLDEGARKEVLVQVENKNALPGSAYQVFAIVETVANGRHISKTIPGGVVIQKKTMSLNGWQIAALAFAFVALTAFVALQPGTGWSNSIQQNKQPPTFLRIIQQLTPLLMLLTITAFLLWNLRPSLLLLDTTTTGGDTPAHNYLASHLKETLFTQMRIVSWSHDWWCGFPVFQFYFFLPYLAMAALDLILPFNIAFKLITVSGILALAPCVYAACRIARLPRITGIIAATAMIPVLFDHTHTMWGLNIYSTLSGMISNSVSFPLMALFTALIYRDAEKGKVRISTALIYSAVIASHFFTCVVGTLTVAAIPLLFIGRGFRKAFKTVLSEGLIGAGLMAWWLIPLIEKKTFAVDFGLNWPVHPLKHLPPLPLLLILSALAITGVILAARKKLLYTNLVAWMFLSSLFLFLWGFKVLSPVFVNVRLWPFMIYSGAFLSAVGLSMILGRFAFAELAAIAALALVLAFGIDRPNNVSSWAKHNYEGLENKKNWHVIEKLVLPLDQTPGRLANDLHDQNNLLGSSRVFECVPHLVDKPILEGGIVNSALGSLFSYYVQGETSRNTAGYPPIVQPTVFNFTNATRHLELLNVKHFIARGDKTRRALKTMEEWQHIDTESGWSLYELMSHAGNYVFIPERQPVALILDSERTSPRKEAALEWIYNIELIDQPFALLNDSDDTGAFQVKIKQDLFETLAQTNIAALASMGRKISSGCSVFNEQIKNHKISFTTTATGMPHVVKTTYYPNWTVKGAPAIHMVTPGFMLVYPDSNQVELRYGYTRADNAGRIVSLIFFVFAVSLTVRKRKIHAISQDIAS